jgi:uncharacterized repeat protein (TIGR03803 family)
MTGIRARASDTFSVLYDFDANAFEPIGNLIFDSSGNIYGTTASGGPESPNCRFNCGAVFKLSPSGGGWNFEIIYSFTGGADGGEPHGRLTLDSKGNIYGTTYAGGTVNEEYCPTGCGTAFELSPSGGGWTFTLLHSFAGPDGVAPWTGLTSDSAGNLYGTTTTGGSGAGTVFKLSSSGGVWTFSILYALANSGSEGEFPFSDLVIDGTGNIYGATQQGGSFKPGCYGCGTVFELSPSGGSWKFSLLHTFQGIKPGAKMGDGMYPWGALVLDSAGSVYGTTFEGGTATCGCGTVFKLSQSAGKWKEQILYRFGIPNYGEPLGGVIMDKSGNLYGTTYDGNAEIFRLAPNPKGSGWKFTSVFSPQDSADGGSPYAGVIVDASGNLYGTTTIGGTNDSGTLFELSPQ